MLASDLICAYHNFSSWFLTKRKEWENLVPSRWPMKSEMRRIVPAPTLLQIWPYHLQNAAMMSLSNFVLMFLIRGDMWSKNVKETPLHHPWGRRLLPRIGLHILTISSKKAGHRSRVWSQVYHDGSTMFFKSSEQFAQFYLHISAPLTSQGRGRSSDTTEDASLHGYLKTWQNERF